MQRYVNDHPNYIKTNANITVETAHEVQQGSSNPNFHDRQVKKNCIQSILAQNKYITHFET